MNRLKIIILLFFPFTFGIFIGARISTSWTKVKTNVLGEKTETVQESKQQRKLVYQEFSPDGEKNLILYELPFLGKGELEYRNHLANQYSIIVETLSNGSESQIFAHDDKTGYPHWLGNEDIFFTGGCGTGCQSLYLVNVNSRESRQGLLEFIPLVDNKTVSIFSDWFGQKFTFQGAVEHMRSAVLDDQIYFIFVLNNPNESSREQKFLFTGEKLIAL